MKIVQSILCIISVIAIVFLIDLFCIGDTGKPVIYFDEKISDNHIFYKGLAYNVYNCNSRNVENGVFIVRKKKDFKCKPLIVEEVKKLVITNIIDKTKEDENFKCSNNKEILFVDDKNIYYFPCPKSEFIVVEYDDGTSENIKEAVSKGIILMSDLEKFKIDYLVEKKEPDEKVEVKND